MKKIQNLMPNLNMSKVLQISFLKKLLIKNEGIINFLILFIAYQHFLLITIRENFFRTFATNVNAT